ncbi:uncharacterized protein BXZ73DRAFT_96540 [Epithele typhae]|uniref:uncharacterized protein n=1 Tax=Epithele typhae TaxID=378194 RepID=UPI002008E93B|nr:uncharacterized protein BXZ73DRAFT_96540 [Epithele typhae]KAH9944027.1 hypothetical protein BXZ73DRAFT_96540 [Epithele typhae]
MATSMYLPQQRGNGLAEKPRPANGLPTHSAAVREKWQKHHHSGSWLVPVSLSIPGVRSRRLRLMIPNFDKLHHGTIMRFGRRRGRILLAVGFLATMVTIYMMLSIRDRFVPEDRPWTTYSDPSTLVFRREDLQRIWEWEIAAGHYPSAAKIPESIGLTTPPVNPALPPQKMASIPTRFRSPSFIDTIGIGAKRVYLDIQSKSPNVAYPPRPLPGSVADMDIVADHCDFSNDKYVRDCLEVLRLGGGLDVGPRVRRGKMDDWKYIYVEDGEFQNSSSQALPQVNPALALKSKGVADPNAGLAKKRNAEWEPHVYFPAPPKYTPHHDRPTSCDENPHLFHMFWTGPFTDKPYLALLSFLYTQNVGLHLDSDVEDPTVCRPKFWLWINPGPAASVPNPSALRDMYDQLKSNPWASPFLHPRFKNVIQFKLWNTTEQLDGIPELKDEWRVLRDSLFNSGGVVEKIPQKAEDESDSLADDSTDTNVFTKAAVNDEDDQANRVGSSSPSTYDRLSVILSDMARFVLCHRFGGIYLDADTILLRDWEELWGWNGAFAYRWSRLPKYNTAVLRMHKGSALGTFLFRTALKNGLDFHPMTVSKYASDAGIEGLLLRLPDALFDSAWLNTEDFQRDRPPQPFFTEFADLFFTPREKSSAPQALGFTGFFRGAYSYHFHNFWWQPFDAARNWPDLGPRFINGERAARALAQANQPAQSENAEPAEDDVKDDKRDLDWSAVLKRTFEAYIRGEVPNAYGEWLKW